MITKNDWFTCKLNSIDFIPHIQPYNFNKLDFNIACEYTAKELHKRYSTIYVAYSGGLDSEYIVRTFHRLSIPIIPIIVSCGNKDENSFAINTCLELNIEPIIINVSEKDLLIKFYEFIFEPFKSIGINCTHAFFAADYVLANKNGVLITGNNLLEDHANTNDDANINDWDFTLGYYNSKLTQIDFFLYDISTAFSMLPNIESINTISVQQYKSYIYNIPFRTKIRPVFSNYFNQIYRKIVKTTPPKSAYYNKKFIDSIIYKYT